MVRRGSSGAAWVGRSTGRPLALVGVVAGVVLLLAAVLVVGGCSGSEAEQPSPSVSGSSGGPLPSGPESSEPSEASPSVGVPVPPSAMRSADEAGAEAFVRHYFALVNHAQATGDLEPLRAVSHPRCAGCQGGLEWLEKAARKSWAIEGGDHRVSKLRVTGVRRDGATFDLSFRLATDGQVVRSKDGGVVDRYRGGAAPAEIAVRSVGGGTWLVLSWATT